MSNYDAFTRVSHAQTIVGQTSVLSENSIPLAVAPGPGGTAVVHGIGSAPGQNFTVTVTEALDGDAGDLLIDTVLADNAALSSNLLVINTVTVPSGRAAVGRQINAPIPQVTTAQLAANGKTHLGLRYRCSNAAATGAFSAWIPLGHSPGVPRVYAANYRGPA